MESLATRRVGVYGYAGRRQKALTRFFLVVFFGAGGFARLDADDDGAEGAGTSGRGRRAVFFGRRGDVPSGARVLANFNFPESMSDWIFCL